MTAKIGYPTLRLIRYGIERLNIDKMVPGDIVELPKSEFYQGLHLKS